VKRSLTHFADVAVALVANVLLAPLTTGQECEASRQTAGARNPAADFITSPSVTANNDDGGIAGGTLNGPDIIVSGIGNTFTEYGVVDGIGGWAMTTVSCNLGDADAIWIDSGPQPNRHPVIGQNMYRLKNGRFEHIGMSWLKHGSCAADFPNCGQPYEPNGSCDWLGTHAADTYNASLNGSQPGLGPRSEINPWTGAYPYPYLNNWNLSGNAIYKRLQINQNDLDPAQNPAAQYFAEVQYVSTDEQPVNRYNNVSHRPVAVGGLTGGGQYDLSFTGTTTQQQPAINAWRAVDPAVILTDVDVPGDGRLILGCKVTNLGGGQWHYEFALYNMNADRAVRSFSLPIPSGITVSNVGFHDVDYHSGESYAGTDWPATGSGGVLEWACQTEAENADANALRWGSNYNFRFDANAPPRCASVNIGLFKAGSPAALSASALGPTNCPADFAPNGSGDGVVDVDDLVGVILAWGDCVVTANCACPADVAPPGGNDVVDVDDLVAVILNWGACAP
jgi:hypothetical protein